MKNCPLFLCIMFIVGCNSGADSNDKDSDTNGKAIPENPVVIQESNKVKEDDSLSFGTFDKKLMQVSGDILISLKTKNYLSLASVVNPNWGIRFSPYAYVDSNNGQHLSASELINLGNTKKVVKWGLHDGTGKPIDLNIDQFFDRFVYPKDFLNAEKRSVNKSNGGGNSLDNLKNMFPGADYTEFYYPGTDPKYGGMDWQKLRLVFKMQNDRLYLVAIIHDEWTI